MNLRDDMSFALANRTGAGFSGDLGYLSAEALALEAGAPYTDARAMLDQMVRERSALTDGNGNFSWTPVQCVLCHDDPCTCVERRGKRREDDAQNTVWTISAEE